MPLGRLVVVLAVLATAPAVRAADDELEVAAEGDRVPRLIEALLDSGRSFKVRATAAVALGRFKDARAAAALAKALQQDGHYAVRVAAASALGRLPSPEGVEALLEALHDDDAFVRESASTALQQFHTPDRVYAFRDALADEDAVIRLAAVRAYGEVLRTSPSVAPLVITALGDDSDAVRAAAETSIASVPHERAVPYLVQALASSSSSVRGAAARLLAKRADATAVEPLILLATSAEESEEVRQGARAALKSHKEYIDVAAQRQAAQDANKAALPARVSALRVLATIDDDKAVDLILGAIAEPDPSVRIGAARAASDLADARGKRMIEAARAKETDARTQKQLDLILKSMR
jgi:HEAT repeat protein